MFTEQASQGQSQGNVFSGGSGSAPALKTETGPVGSGLSAGGASDGLPGAGGDGASQLMGHWSEGAPGGHGPAAPAAAGPGESPAGALLHGGGGAAGSKSETGAWDFGAAWQGLEGGSATSAIAGGMKGPAHPEMAPTAKKNASNIADKGFSEGGHEVPHRAEMEKSFGMDFSAVKAHSGGAAAAANKGLHSHAYAMGSQVAFKSANPDPALVAHELTHVLQHSNNGGGPAPKRDGKVDTEGEGEAEAVEAAVRAGKPAHSALQNKAAGVGPALKGKRPALSAEGGGFMEKFGMGMSFSKEKFEQSYSWKILDLKSLTMPLPVPGMFFLLDIGATVKGGGGVEYGGENKGNGFISCGVEGTVGAGLGGGVPNVVMGYGMLEGKLAGNFGLNSQTAPEAGAGGEHAGGEHAGGEHAGGEAKPGGWNLQGTISAEASGKIGVGLGPNRIVDKSFELGKLEIFKLTGVYFDAKGFRRDKLGFEWGAKIKEIINEIKTLIDKAKHLGGAAVNGAKKVGGKIASGAKSIWHGLGL